MKKSSIFLIVFLLASVIGSMIVNFVLGMKYENIDRSDPFFGRKKIELPPFKYVKIQGGKSNQSESIFIQPGNDFCFWTKIDTSKIGWHVKSDTLHFEFKSIHLSGWDGARPDFYLIAPHVAGITINGGICKIEGWNIPKLNVQIGSEWGWVPEVMLAENTIDSLLVKMKCDDCLEITNDNKISTKSISKLGYKF